jgi:hypothetical protein
MKPKSLTVALFALTCAFAASLQAGTPEQEKAFVDKYKTAFEAGDKATLESFLYTKGAHPKALEFYKMMQTEGSGSKIGKIELLDLSPEEAKEAEGIEEMPDGSKTKFPLKPTKKLKISIETKNATSNSSSSSTCLVAEKDGKFVIPVPVPAK